MTMCRCAVVSDECGAKDECRAECHKSSVEVDANHDAICGWLVADSPKNRLIVSLISIDRLGNSPVINFALPLSLFWLGRLVSCKKIVTWV